MPDLVTLELPAAMDTQAASGLLALFQSARGSDLRIEAGAVRRVGALCLQILLAARAAWQADGLAFQCGEISPELIAGLELFGVTSDFSI